MPNTQRPVRLRARLYNGWQQLTTPLVTIEDPGNLYRARLLASLFLAAMLVVMVFIVLSLVILNYEPDVELQNIIRTGSVITLLFGYLLCRQGRQELALGWGAVVASATLFLHALTPGGMFGLNVLYYLGAVIFVCGLFASIRITLTAFAVQPIGIVVLLLLRPDITPAMLFVPMLFNVVMTFFIVVGVYYRRQLDDEKNARLQQSETRYRALVNSISDIIYTVSPEGIITSINPAITTATGWLPEDMVSKSFMSFVHPDDTPVAMQEFMTTLNGQPTPPFEVRIIGKDGKYWWVENVPASQIENGQVVGVTGSMRDITARRQAEQARLQTERRLSILVEQMPLAVIEINLKGLITGWNPAAEQIFGYTTAEAFWKENTELLVPDHLRQHVAGVFDNVLAERRFVHNINQNTTRDGRIILCEWFNILLMDDDDKPVGFLCVAIDITERRQADEQRLKLILVQERMSVLKRFMDALSHDFRTALSQIETSRYLLERSLSPEAATSAQPRFNSIAASIRHMETQLGNLNTISALSNLHLAPHDLNRLVQHLVDARRVMADAKNLSLTLQLTADLPSLLVDDDKLHDALAHLLNNAIAYTPAGGSIRLQTRFHEDCIHIDVIDTGIGVAPEHISSIFDLFYRVDSARPLNTGGVGLGLSIARLVAEAHGGTITAASTLGQGSTFTLSLPVMLPITITAPA